MKVYEFECYVIKVDLWVIELSLSSKFYLTEWCHSGDSLCPIKLVNLEYNPYEYSMKLGLTPSHPAQYINSAVGRSLLCRLRNGAHAICCVNWLIHSHLNPYMPHKKINKNTLKMWHHCNNTDQQKKVNVSFIPHGECWGISWIVAGTFPIWYVCCSVMWWACTSSVQWWRV